MSFACAGALPTLGREALPPTPSPESSAGRGLSNSSRLGFQAEAPGGPQQHSFCIPVGAEFTQTTLGGAPRNCATLQPHVRLADPQRPPSSPAALRRHSHPLCCWSLASHWPPGARGLLPSWPLPGQLLLLECLPAPAAPLLDIAPSGTAAGPPVCLPSWTRGVLRVGAALSGSWLGCLVQM